MPKCNVEEVVGEPPPFQRLHEVFLCQSEFAADRETERSHWVFETQATRLRNKETSPVQVRL